MTRIIDTSAKRHLSAKLAAGIAISAILALGTFAGSARADEYNHYYGGRSYNDYYRGGQYDGYYSSGYYNDYYGNGYYRAPSYGPGVGISLPFVGIGIY